MKNNVKCKSYIFVSLLQIEIQKCMIVKETQK